MNYNIRREWPLLFIIAATFIAAFLVYPHMPEQVPTHWNIKGEVDDYGSKLFGTFFLPLLNLGMYVFFLIIPKLDPKRANYSKFDSSYLTIRYALHLFFALMFGITAAAALGYPVRVDQWIPGGIAVMFIILGNVMGRVRHNYFVGFKFPWTLANEEVWRRTHQFGGKLMVLGGFAALIGVIFTRGSGSFIAIMIGLMVPTLITTIYSYIIFKQITR